MLNYNHPEQKWIFSERRMVSDVTRGGPSASAMKDKDAKDGKLHYTKQQMICFCRSGNANQPEVLSDDTHWIDCDSGKRLQPQILVRPKLRPVSNADARSRSASRKTEDEKRDARSRSASRSKSAGRQQQRSGSRGAAARSRSRQRSADEYEDDFEAEVDVQALLQRVGISQPQGTATGAATKSASSTAAPVDPNDPLSVLKAKTAEINKTLDNIQVLQKEKLASALVSASASSTDAAGQAAASSSKADATIAALLGADAKLQAEKSSSSGSRKRAGSAKGRAGSKASAKGMRVGGGYSNIALETAAAERRKRSAALGSNESAPNGEKVPNWWTTPDGLNKSSAKKIEKLRKGLLEDCSEFINNLVGHDERQQLLRMRSAYAAAGGDPRGMNVAEDGMGPPRHGVDDATGTGSTPGDFASYPRPLVRMTDKMNFEKHVVRAEVHEDNYARGGAAHQLSLAIREYREAQRIMPGDQEVRKRIQYLQKEMAPLKNPPAQTPMLRFVSHYNLSIRYWDQGKAVLAIKEVENCIAMLSKFHLPLSGAVHMLDRMVSVHASVKKREGELLEAEEKLSAKGQSGSGVMALSNAGTAGGGGAGGPRLVGGFAGGAKSKHSTGTMGLTSGRAGLSGPRTGAGTSGVGRGRTNRKSFGGYAGAVSGNFVSNNLGGAGATNAAISLAYKLGVLFFDKRMLLRAEQYLTRAEALIRERAAVVLYKAGNVQMQAESGNAAAAAAASGAEEGIERQCKQLRADYAGIKDDLFFLRQMQTDFCSELGPGAGPGASNKDPALDAVGIRDNIAPGLLPLFVLRFDMEGDVATASQSWMKDLIDRPNLDWQV